MQAISAAIFDIGGVLTTSPVTSIRRFCEREGIEHALIAPLLAGEGTWARFERGEIGQAEFVGLFERDCRGLGVTLNGWHFLDSFFGVLSVRDEMVGAVRILRGRLGLGCITNNVARDDSRPRGIFDLDSLFDVVVESSKVGMRKPDPRIYTYTCELLGVEPERCVFLDDFGVNLKAARALGMVTIKVDETLAALEQLEEVLGVPLR